MKFQTPYANHIPGQEVYTQKSMTVPDMSMTVEEIMQRFQSGRGIAFNQNMSYTGDQWLPDVKKMDFTEVAELAEANLARIKALEAEIAEKQRLRKEKWQSEKDAYNALIKRLETDSIENTNMNPPYEGSYPDKKDPK